MCEFCGQSPCVCDRDNENPVDMDAEHLMEFYSNLDDFDEFLDNDHGMDY